MFFWNSAVRSFAGSSAIAPLNFGVAFGAAST
jgi:hypothetical protein